MHRQKTTVHLAVKCSFQWEQHFSKQPKPNSNESVSTHSVFCACGAFKARYCYSTSVSPSIGLSLRLIVTRWYSVKTAKRIVKILSLCGNSITAEFSELNAVTVTKFWRAHQTPIRLMYVILENIVFGHKLAAGYSDLQKILYKTQHPTRINKNVKIEQLKLADGRQFENCSIAIFQSNMIWFWWKFVC